MPMHDTELVCISKDDFFVYYFTGKIMWIKPYISDTLGKGLSAIIPKFRRTITQSAYNTIAQARQVQAYRHGQQNVYIGPIGLYNIYICLDRIDLENVSIPRE